jgi:hypothetical protein
MRHALLTTAAAAVLMTGAVACQSSLPDPPVAAPISDLDAARLADLYLDEQNVGERTITSIEPHGYGYFVSHKTTFMEDDEPVTAWQVVDVRHDGNLRHVEFGDKD